MMNQIMNQFRNKNYLAFLVFSRKVYFFSHANDESESTMRKKKLSSIKTRPSGPQCVLTPQAMKVNEGNELTNTYIREKEVGKHHKPMSGQTS